MLLYVFDMFHSLLSGDSLRDLWNVYIYIYICVCVCVCVCVCACMYVCMHEHLTISNEANCWNMVHCHVSF